jgi:hypothetical protein
MVFTKLLKSEYNQKKDSPSKDLKKTRFSSHLYVTVCEPIRTLVKVWTNTRMIF